MTTIARRDPSAVRSMAGGFRDRDLDWRADEAALAIAAEREHEIERQRATQTKEEA